MIKYDMFLWNWNSKPSRRHHPKYYRKSPFYYRNQRMYSRKSIFYHRNWKSFLQTHDGVIKSASLFSQTSTYYQFQDVYYQKSLYIIKTIPFIIKNPNILSKGPKPQHQNVSFHFATIISTAAPPCWTSPHNSQWRTLKIAISTLHQVSLNHERKTGRN